MCFQWASLQKKNTHYCSHICLNYEIHLLQSRVVDYYFHQLGILWVALYTESLCSTRGCLTVQFPEHYQICWNNLQWPNISCITSLTNDNWWFYLHPLFLWSVRLRAILCFNAMKPIGPARIETRVKGAFDVEIKKIKITAALRMCWRLKLGLRFLQTATLALIAHPYNVILAELFRFR